MKLDVNVLRYMSQEEFRVLTAVEMGQRNHQIVPVQLVESIAGLRHGGTFKLIRNLLRHKLLHHENTSYDGYRLTPLGYDYLAIKALLQRGSITSVGRQIGVGKESDIFEVANDEGEIMVLKLHRLGRTSFRAVKQKRDYLQNRTQFSWLYLSRLSAVKEFAFMKALGENGFPVPRAIETNRHCVLMSMCDGFPMTQIRKLGNPGVVYKTMMNIIVRLGQHGLIHCDYNEFNLIIDDNEEVTMIDFPQMVSTKHANAEDMFNRDADCIRRFFRRRYDYRAEDDPEIEPGWPRFEDVVSDSHSIDKELKASGFSGKMQADLDKFIEAAEKEGDEGEGEEEEESEGEEEGEEEEEEEEEEEGGEEIRAGFEEVTLDDVKRAAEEAEAWKKEAEAIRASAAAEEEGGGDEVPELVSARGGRGGSDSGGEGASEAPPSVANSRASRMTGYTIGSVTSEDIRKRVMDARRKGKGGRGGGSHPAGHQNYNKARSSKGGNRGGGSKAKANEGAADFGGW